MQMPIWDHLEELRERVLVGALAAGLAVLTCFAYSKDLVVFLEAPVASQGVRFLQLSPGEFFFTTLKVSASTFLLGSAPVFPLEETQTGAETILHGSVEAFLTYSSSHKAPTPAARASEADFIPTAASLLTSDIALRRWLAMLASCWQHLQSSMRLLHMWCLA